jgi:hypothetical protein
MVWRAWDLLDLTGEEHALTMLRQGVAAGRAPEFGALMVQLFDRYHLLDRPRVVRLAEDAWVDRMSRTIFEVGRRQAVEAVASALAEGIDPQALGEAITLVMLHDPGDGGDGRFVHGGQAGVHASDAANAWRNIMRVSNERNARASLIAAAWYVGGARDGGVTAGGRYMKNGGLKHAYPFPEHLEGIRTKDPAALLREADGAIRENDQGRACAAVQRYGELGCEPKPVIDMLLRYATSEEGHDHAEKYYHTASQEFATTGPRSAGGTWWRSRGSRRASMAGWEPSVGTIRASRRRAACWVSERKSMRGEGRTSPRSSERRFSPWTCWPPPRKRSNRALLLALRPRGGLHPPRQGHFGASLPVRSASRINSSRAVLRAFSPG